MVRSVISKLAANLMDVHEMPTWKGKLAAWENKSIRLRFFVAVMAV